MLAPPDCVAVTLLDVLIKHCRLPTLRKQCLYFCSDRVQVLQSRLYSAGMYTFAARVHTYHSGTTGRRLYYMGVLVKVSWTESDG